MIVKNTTTTQWDLDQFGVKCQHFYEPKDYQLKKIKVESPYLPTYRAEYSTRDVLRQSNIVKVSHPCSCCALAPLCCGRGVLSARALLPPAACCCLCFLAQFLVLWHGDELTDRRMVSVFPSAILISLCARLPFPHRCPISLLHSSTNSLFSIHPVTMSRTPP